MAELTVREMSIRELRSRVEEAEKILRLARQLAQNELRDPESCERAKDRIAALCDDVNALFPGLADEVPQAAAAEVEAAVEEAQEAGAEDEEEEGEQGGEEGDEGEEGEEGEEEEDTEWDVDYEKLRASLSNPELMGRFPDGGAQFRVLAEQLLDAHDRHALYARISDGFAELEAVTREGADQVRQQLAVALTLEELKNKRLD